MRRNKRFIKTILCLALSTAMVFPDMGMTAAASESAAVEELPSENKEEEISDVEESGQEKETEAQASKESKTEEVVSEESVTEKETSGETETEKNDAEETLPEKASIEETDAEETEEESSITEEIVNETATTETEVEETAVEQKLMFAEDDISHGEYKEDGNDITWVIDADGELTVAGTGNFAADDDWSPSRAPWYDKRDTIKSAVVDVTGMTNASYMFYECTDLSEVNLGSFDTSNITQMKDMFNECSSLTKLDVSSFDTNQVTNMWGMFRKCSSLTSLDVSNFNTSQVTDMGAMFFECSKLTSLDVGKFDTRRVTNMSGMFTDCSELTSLDVSNFKTDNVMYMEGMFDRCSGLTSLDVSNFKTDNVTNMSFMFRKCSGLMNLDVSNFKTSQVTNMRAIFDRCNSLTELNVSNFDTSQVTDMMWMFQSCENLISLDVSRFDTSQVADMSYMFDDCKSLTGLNVSGFDTSQVTDMSWMFNGCESLTELNVSGFDTSQVTDMSWMFNGCKSLTGLNVSGFDTSQVIDMSWMFNGCMSLTGLNVSNFDTSQVKDMKYMFSYCSGITELDVSGFNTSQATNMSWMFYKCSGITELNVSVFKTSQVTNMGGMFGGCSGLTSLDLSSFDTSQVTDMEQMFISCSGMTELDVSVFDTSQVTNMYFMFSGCSGLTSLDLSSFDTGQVTDMADMFSYCSGLTNLYLNSFNTNQVTDMQSMFSYCSKLISLDLSSFDMSKVTKNIDGQYETNRMFYDCKALTTLYTPYNLTQSVVLPITEETDIWRDMAGTEYTSLPQNLDHSILLARNGKPAIEDYIVAVIPNTRFNCGDTINTDKLTVRYYSSDGTVRILSPSEYTTNAADIDTSEPGEQILKVTYIGLTAEIKLTVTKPQGGSENKTSVQISGISFSDNGYSYNKQPVSYTGTVTVRTEDGTDITDQVALLYAYTGTLADDSVYDDTAEAPVNAGSYKLTVSISEDDKNYTGSAEYSFSIAKAPLVITARDMELKIGAELPKTEDYKFDTAGLLEGDMLITNPTLSCNITDTAAAGTYEIVVSGADAGMNYAITYKNGTLTVNENGETEAYYTVTFNMSGHGSDIMNTGIKEGSLLEKPQDPQAEGYTFTGWYKDQSCTVKWDFATDTVQADTVLYAGWTKKDEGGGDDKYDDTDDSQYTDEERTDLSAAGAAISNIKAKTYDGNAYEPVVKVSIKVNGKTTTLIEGTDYRVLYENNVAAGKAKVTVKGNGVYKGSLTKEYAISPKSIKKLKIVAGGMSKTAVVSEGSLSELPIYVYDGTKLLQYGTDYTLSNYTPSKSSAKVTVTGAGNYGGAATAKVTLYSADSNKIINPENVSLDISAAAYTGKAVKNIKPTVKIDDVTLAENKDYKVQYTNNTNAGTAFVIVTGKGAYKGRVIKTFTIKEAEVSSDKVTIKPISAKTFNRKLQKPSVTVTVPNGNKTKKLVKNKDYTVTYINNLHAGENTAVVIITGKGNYAGIRKEATFTIKPQKLSKASLKGTQGNLTLTYAKRVLKEGSDYDTPQYGEVKKNSIKVSITGKGDFTGTITKSVKIR